MTRTDRVIDAHRRTYDRLSALVAGLSDEDLTHQSGASDWAVAQVLSHIGSGSEIHLDTLRHAQAGDERPGDANDAVWARWNAMSPREQADSYVLHGKTLVDWLAQLDADERSNMKVSLPYLPEPAGLDLYIGLRLNEDALHGWDVAVAFDDDAEIAPDTAAVLLELLQGPIGFMLGFTGKTAPLGGRAVTLAVRTPEATVGLALAERAALTAAPEAPDAELRLSLEAFLRLMAGRLRDLPAEAVTGSITADELRQVFPGY
jgi:uncharacterized protein (TIGR03083 family)